MKESHLNGLSKLQHLQSVRAIQDLLCFVASDYEAQLEEYIHNPGTTNYTLPNGEVITINNDLLLRAPETLFQPDALTDGEKTSKGIDELVYESIMACDDFLRDDMFRNILITGRHSLYNGFADRLLSGVNELTPSHIDVKVIAPKEREYAAWIGGSILASLLPVSEWLTKEQYEKKRCRDYPFHLNFHPEALFM